MTLRNSGQQLDKTTNKSWLPVTLQLSEFRNSEKRKSLYVTILSWPNNNGCWGKLLRKHSKRTR